MKILFFLLFFSNIVSAQKPLAPSALRILGTRSWIRLDWKDHSGNEQGFKIYFSTRNKKPDSIAAVVDANTTRYYLQNVIPKTKYFVWIEAFNQSGTSKALTGVITTITNWVLDSLEATHLDILSSDAVPAGMQLFWHDEFNDELLNRNKWTTNYYSTIDFLRKENLQALLHDSLPQAAYKLNGHSIDLFVNDSLPVKAFSNGKKISSLQTYNWSTNENLLDNSRGGYFEVRVRRNYSGKPQGLNTAFWFDSPGPDLKYYLPEDATVYGTKGIRPKGQLFEIDIFENLDAQFVMHGKVDSNGRFIHNLATDIATGYTHRNEWVVHGLLWTPTSIKHYINGKLIKAYDNKHQIYSPNHFMNILLGSYGKGGTVDMEVDYIRGYQWPLVNGNELPNPGFELGNSLDPWEGSATRSKSSKRTGNYGVVLGPGQILEQYVYLNNSTNYQLKYWLRGSGIVNVKVENIMLVSGITENTYSNKSTAAPSFAQHSLDFATANEYGNNMKTIKVSFSNEGNDTVTLDDLKLVKGGSGGKKSD